MTAQIIRLDPRSVSHRSNYEIVGASQIARTPNASHQPATIEPQPTDFRFWTGASGKRYVHTVYSLIACPQLPAGNYVLMARAKDGTCTTLAVGRTTDQAQSLNLAHIRHLAAKLGANEVHVHLLATDPRKSKFVEYDIRAACFGQSDPSKARH